MNNVSDDTMRLRCPRPNDDAESVSRLLSTTWQSPEMATLDKPFSAWFQSALDGWYHQFVIAEELTCKDVPQTIGCAFSWDYRFVDGHCRASVLVEEAESGVSCTRYAWLATSFLLNLFAEYPVRTVFFESIATLSAPVGWGAWGTLLPPLQHELTLKEYLFYRGAYRDVDVWSLSRADISDWGKNG